MSQSAAAPMRLVEDRLLVYRGYHGCRSECRVRIFAPADRKQPHLVIVSELETNLGTSVTNAAEVIASDLWCYLEKPEAGLLYVEHYPNRCFLGQGPARRPMLKEEWDVVVFERETGAGQFQKPGWRRVPKWEVEALVGAALR